MDKDYEAKRARQCSALSDQLQQMTLRYVSSQEIPGSTVVFITEGGDGCLTFFTDSLWLAEGKLGHMGVTLPSIYRFIRKHLNIPRKPITFVVGTVDLVLTLLDELENEVRFKRVALALNRSEMPLAPPNPDQHLVDFIAELEAHCDALATDP